jgi:lipoprotein-anchoring transpeptidase ErfK/SrfK
VAGISAPEEAEAREVVRVNFNAEPGTIVIRNSERRLYLVKENGIASATRGRRPRLGAVGGPHGP